jgi:arginase
MRPIAILDAPSNLGLPPPLEGSVPGCYKLGWALRESGALQGVDVEEAGVVVPPRYEAAWAPGDGDRNATQIASYSGRLADRIGGLIDESFVVVLGGDCSVLIGAALALKRRGRYGLAFLDGHSDFRHPANVPPIGAAAGEDLAIVTGRGDPRLVDLEDLGQSVAEADVAVVGVRSDDKHAAEIQDLGMSVWPVDRLRAEGHQAVTAAVLEQVARAELDGFWVHLDVDILDAEFMPAVDTPSDGGLQPSELTKLLSGLVSQTEAVGIDLCIFDPDLDPDGQHAQTLAPVIHETLTSAAAGIPSSRT